jgi:trigger factor
MSVTTSVEALEGNKVRLHVAIPAADFEQAIDAAFRKLAHEVKLPGFRPGKAPRRLLEARMGTEIARDQALRDSLPEYYAEAVVAEDVDVIAPPEIDITAGEDDGDVEFDAVVEVRPVVTVEGHDALRIEIEKPDVSEEVVDQQVDSLRERFADLEDSSDPLTDGDYAEIDIKGSIADESIEGLSATDYLYEVGSGIVVPKLDEELHGKRPGDILKFDDTLPERFGDRAGEEAAFQVLVKEAKKKVLPELTDEWVSEVSEFDTVDALKADVRTRLDIYARVQASMAVRERIFAAAADLVTVDVPETLVSSEMERRLHDLAHRLEEQGIRMTIPQYLAATGQDQQEFVENVRVGAAEAVRADLALRAVITQEAIAATDEEVDAEIDQLAERMNEKPAKVRKDLERRGVVEAVRSDIARGKALAFLIEHAEVVDADGEPVDLSLPQPEAPAEGSEGADSDGPAAEPAAEPPAEASAPQDQEASEPEVPEEEPAQ